MIKMFQFQSSPRAAAWASRLTQPMPWSLKYALMITFGLAMVPAILLLVLAGLLFFVLRLVFQGIEQFLMLFAGGQPSTARRSAEDSGDMFEGFGGFCGDGASSSSGSSGSGGGDSGGGRVNVRVIERD